MKRNRLLLSKPPAGASTQSHLLLSLLFGLSGAGALIYEVIWSKSLQFIFGSTTETVSTILAGMLMGFSLGSFAFRQRAEKTDRPLFHFAMLEAGIGFYGLAMPILTIGARGLYSSGPDLFILRLAYCVGLVLLPSVLLGALWPYVGRYCLENQPDRGSRAGVFYAMNAFGSALGATAAGFYLIPALGLMKTSWLAASFNFMIAGVTFAMERSHRDEK